METGMTDFGTPPASGDFDLSRWPVARYRMPDRVPDAEAEARVAEFDALLARDERFVLDFHGPEMPKDSSRFMKAYRAWFKARKDAQKRLCAGAVRVEPDAARRGSFAVKAMSLMNKAFLPYPYRVVASDAEADAQARAWLAA
ncbi:hypothetical protein [Methylobacterium sp. WSM2598]|uniref:hypothetical protein n=1 Tax=Methylobacterium sp. WSM2598 TaxID=398261 RepID=UPI000367C67A|nr:hypothetical protein [Methylobacterium sp. WSM2598]